MTAKERKAHPAGSARKRVLTVVPRSTLDLAPDPRERVQTVIARCYVAIAEMDYDLACWREELDYPWQVIDLRVPSAPLTRI